MKLFSRTQLELIACIGTVLCLVASNAAWAETRFTWQSHSTAQCPEPLGEGSSGTLTDADGTWRPSIGGASFGDVGFGFIEAGGPTNRRLWHLQFEAPRGEELVPRSYLVPAVSGASGREAALSVAYDGRVCNVAEESSFRVSEIQFDIYGFPIRFAADFSVRCQTATGRALCSPGDGVLTGRIDSTFDGTLGSTTFSPGNTLLTAFNEDAYGVGNLLEVTPAGDIVQVLPLARMPGGPPAPRQIGSLREHVKDAVFDGRGNVHVLIGGEDPWLGTLDPRAGAWSYRQVEGWDVSLEETEAPLTAFGDYVFATDHDLSNERTGIIRFDVAAGVRARRFAEGAVYRDLDVGLDGRLYALRENRRDVEIYDPRTMRMLGALTLDRASVGVAVNEDGEIFGFSSALGEVYRFDRAGTLTARRDTSLVELGLSLLDVDVSGTGAIAFGVRAGWGPGVGMVRTDRTLSSYRVIVARPGQAFRPHTHAFVAFVEPPPA